jgi:DNA-nicking Smr family endonuclease
MTNVKKSVSKEDAELFRQTIGEIKPLRHNKQHPKSPTKEKRISAIAPKRKALTGAESWLTYLAPEDWLDPEDSLHFAKTGVQHKIIQQLKRGQIPLEARLDLHRQTLNEAMTTVTNFIDICVKQGKRCVCIIHGKGRISANAKPVLKNFLNQFLRQHTQVLAFQSTIPKHGGTGAVYVLLKRGAPHEK